MVPVNQTGVMQPLVEDTNAWFGVGINSYMASGVGATQWLDPTFNMPSNAVLYGPTLKCPTPSPLEVTTTYDGWHDSARFIGVWDHALGIDDWAWSISDATAESEGYLNTYNGRQYYDVRICRDLNGDWGAFLYNFGTDTWDEKYSESSDNTQYPGWDSYEAHWNSGTSWPQTPYVESSNLELLISGLIWITDYWYAGLYSYESNYNLEAFDSASIYYGYFSQYDHWYAGDYYVQGITFAGGLSGQGNAWDGDYLKGPLNDGQYARIYAGNYGDAGAIMTALVAETTGYIWATGYGLSGYYNSHLYCYVSEDGTNWYGVQGSPTAVNYWDGVHNIYCGYYSGNFKYVAFAGYYDNGYSVNLALDHVFVYRSS